MRDDLSEESENTISDVLDASLVGRFSCRLLVAARLSARAPRLVVNNEFDKTEGTYKIRGALRNDQDRLWSGQ